MQKCVSLVAWLRFSYLASGVVRDCIFPFLSVAHCLIQILEAPAVCKYETYSFPKILDKTHIRVAKNAYGFLEPGLKLNVALDATSESNEEF